MSKVRFYPSHARRTLCLFFLLFTVGLLQTQNAQAEPEKVWEDSIASHKAYINPDVNQSMTELVKATLPAVVSISTEQKIRLRGRGRGRGNSPTDEFFDYFFNQPFGKNFKQRGMGSGFIISKSGYILTNNHVVENADNIKVKLTSGEEYPAEVVGLDPNTDMALIKVNAGANLPYLILGDSDRLEIGHLVVAMGNPLGLSHTVTSGIVSQKGRKDINPSGRKIYANFIQTDASINPGNSGGPLLNIYGEAIGINTAIAQGTGIGFAIPINMAKTLLPQLAAGKIERSWIGIRVQQLTTELAESLGLSNQKGALIAAIIEDSPAEKAGLKPEDVILEIDGKKIETWSDLTWYASTAGVNKTVTLKVWRNRDTRTIKVKLGRMPGETSVATSDNPAPSKSHVVLGGITAGKPSNAQLKGAGILDGKGAVVLSIEPGTSAHRAGLMPGDIIRKVNQSLIRDAKHLEKVAKKIRKGKMVRLFVNRKQMALFVAFRYAGKK